MKKDHDKIFEKPDEVNTSKIAEDSESGQQPDQKDQKDHLKTDPLYQFLKPLHNLPRGKNTWDPQIIKKWWFWPVSALFLIVLFYVYPYIWDFFAG